MSIETRCVFSAGRAGPRVYSARAARSRSLSHVRVFWAVLMVAATFGLWLAITSTAHGGIAFFYVVPIGLVTCGSATAPESSRWSPASPFTGSAR